MVERIFCMLKTTTTTVDGLVEDKKATHDKDVMYLRHVCWSCITCVTYSMYVEVALCVLLRACMLKLHYICFCFQASPILFPKVINLWRPAQDRRIHVMNVQHTCVLCRPILNVHDVCCIKLVGLKCELTRGVLSYNQYLECPRRMLYIVSGRHYNIHNVCCI